MTAYLDASALVKLLVDEPETDALRSYLTRIPERATSLVGTAETTRAVLRRAPDRLTAAAALLLDIAVITFDERIARVAGRIGPPSLRTLDSIHLASALELGSDLEAFVTYDGRLADAARRMGLPVAAPGENGSALATV